MRGNATSAVAPSRPRRRMWLAIAAIGASAIIVALIFFALRMSPEKTSIAALVSASPTNARLVEPRLSGGFAWAPLAKAKRGEAVDLAFAGAVGSTLAAAQRESTPEARHTASVGQLLVGQQRAALATLSALTKNDDRAELWNDLAVASYETARQYDAPELLADALFAADRALRRSPAMLEALFNRALIIERLGLRDAARSAWEEYLRNDAGSAWSLEAREHLRSLQPEKPFLELVDQETRAGNDHSIRGLARRYPEDARTRGELDILGRWAAASNSGDERASQRYLAIARALGEEVATINGDRMLKASVASIDAATQPSLALLAEAHAKYESGRRAFKTNQPVAAEAMLRGAARDLERAGSSLALSARYFAANTAFEQGRHNEAQRELEMLLRSVPADFPALTAEIRWQLGVCHATAARWGEAITSLAEAAAAFDRLGESNHAAAVRRITAAIYDRIGDSSTAWKHRMAALPGLGRRPGLPLEKTLQSIADALVLEKKWEAAASFMNLEIDLARRLGDDVQLANALLMRAIVRHRLDDESGSRADVNDAEVHVAGLDDAAYRRYLQTETLAVKASLTASADEAVQLLTTAIEFQMSHGARMNLPRLYLQRARALRKLKEVQRAEVDLERGMTELDGHRQSLPHGETRWGAFHGNGELFEEAIDLALECGEVERAFATAERSRARALLDSYGVAPSGKVGAVPANSVVVEYVALPSRLVIFAADSRGVEAVSTNVDRQVIRDEINALTQALRSDATMRIRRAATVLYKRLVQPVEHRLHNAETIAFVPDAVTAGAPFSALIDPSGAYLLERHSVVTAPSASVFSAQAQRADEDEAPESVLVLANSLPGQLERLPSVKLEAEGVCRAYRSAERLYDEKADFDEFRKSASRFDVIHFAGHAIGDDEGFEPASIVLRQDGKERRVNVSEIARLRLKSSAIVVLAGCNTARGETRATEGVISMAHGFLSAGASSVVATLWPISDVDAAVFSPRLHARLAEGVSPAQALREIQLEAIHQRDVPPSLWAALQVIGR